MAPAGVAAGKAAVAREAGEKVAAAKGAAVRAVDAGDWGAQSGRAVTAVAVPAAVQEGECT